MLPAFAVLTPMFRLLVATGTLVQMREIFRLMAQEQSGAPLFYVASDQPCALLLPDTEEYLQSVMAAGLRALNAASPPQPVPQPGTNIVQRIQIASARTNFAASGNNCCCWVVYQRGRSSSETSEESS